MDRSNNLEEFIANPGLCHIVKNISSFLDLQSLAQCRLVSQTWRGLIDNDRPWQIFQLEFIHNQEKWKCKSKNKNKPKGKTTIKEVFPKWNAFITKISQRLSIPTLKELVRHMWSYLSDDYLSYRRHPFLHAIEESNIQFVQLLIDCGIDLKMRDAKKWTPLHYACMHGNIQMVKLIAKHIPNFDTTSVTNKGWTIFHMAVRNQDPHVAKLILNSFRFENIRDGFGWTMLQHAVGFGSKKVIQFLIDNQRKIGLNMEERFDHNPEANRATILHIACGSRDITIVDQIKKALEETNSNVGFDTRDTHNWSPLHNACYHGTSNVVIQLLQRFPEKINDLGDNGWHLLHFACYSGHIKLLKYMMKTFDIDFNVATASGATPLHIACWQGQFEAVEFLLKHSKEKELDIKKKDFFQLTAEDWTRIKGHDDVLELFWKHNHPVILLIRSVPFFEEFILFGSICFGMMVFLYMFYIWSHIWRLFW